MLWLLAIPAWAHAQEAAIVVTGRSLAPPLGDEAYAGVMIGRERLTLNASERLEGVLSDVAGFAAFRRSDSRSTNPTAQGATLRGLGGNAASRALVLLDGVPQGDPFFGSVPFNALAPNRLGSVRVTRGGGTGAFGAGAVAGTIELESSARDQTPLLAASGSYGSFNSNDVATTVAPSLGSGFLTFSGRYERADGFFTTPPEQRTAATARARYRDWSGSVRAVIPIGIGELQARGAVFSDMRILRFAGADNSSSGGDASVRLIARGRWQVDALAYVQARDFSTVVISATSFRKTLDQRATPSTGVGGKIEVRPPVGGGHVLRIGLDSRASSGTAYEDSYGASGAVTSRRSESGNASTAGLFVEDSWGMGSLTLTGGVRLDRWTLTQGRFREVPATGATIANQSFPDRSGVEPSFRVGTLVAVSPLLKLRAARLHRVSHADAQRTLQAVHGVSGDDAGERSTCAGAFAWGRDRRRICKRGGALIDHRFLQPVERRDCKCHDRDEPEAPSERRCHRRDGYRGNSACAIRPLECLGLLCSDR